MDNSDIINELSKRYNELHKEFKSVQDLVNDIDFVFDYTEEEQWLFYRMRSTMEEYCGALLRLIRFLKKKEREEQGVKDWTQFKKTDSAYIGVDVSDEGDHGACTQVCGDDMFKTQHDPNFDDVDPEQKAMAMSHCGQDATCQVGDGSAVVKGQIGYDTRMIGMQVVGIGDMRCEGCPAEQYGEKCVKLELVDGTYLCLAPLPNSIFIEQSLPTKKQPKS